MKTAQRILLESIVLALLGLCVLTFLPGRVFAQLALPEKDVLGASAASVSAQVGEFTLSLTGFIAPYASVTLTSNDIVLRSSVADAQGYFSISQVLIKAGFSSFCLDAIDYKRLGESESCFTVPPAVGSIVKTNIFLPPTLGVFRTDVNVGDKALVFGYSMPGANVHVHVNSQIGCDVTADSTGYYECQISIAKAGSYELYAEATLNGKPSEPQLKKVLIQGLSLSQQIVKKSQSIWDKIWNFLIGLPFGYLWLAIPLIILIIILIWRLKPEWFPRLEVPHPAKIYQSAFDSLFKERRLHHWWMKGVGY